MRFAFLFLISTSIWLTPSAILGADLAVDGVLDLKAINLDQESINLNGEWEFYWGQLLRPEDSFPARPDYINVPALWNSEQSRSGVILSNIGFGTYRLKVLLPQNSPDLGLFIKHVYSAYTLYVDGREMDNQGYAGADESSVNAKWVPQVINLNPVGDTLEIILQVANFEHRKGGIREPIVLGEYNPSIPK